MSSYLKDRLLADRKKEYMAALAEEVLTSAELLDELVTLMITDTSSKLSHRAGYVFMHLTDLDITKLSPYLDRLIQALKEGVSMPIRRNIVRVFQYIEVPEQRHEDMLMLCFEFLSDHKEAIAIKAFSMTVLYNLCTHYPELKPELREQIYYQLELPSASPGIKARGKQILKKLG